LLLARLLFERRRELRMWAPDDEPTRLISQLSQARRETVDERTRWGLQLLDLLRNYFPALLQIASHQLGAHPALLAVLAKWPDPQQLKRVHPQTLAAVLKEHGVRRREELVANLRSAQVHCRDRVINHVCSLKAAWLAKQIMQCNKAIEQYDLELEQAVAAHPDHELFASIRGAGAALLPRIIAALGSDRNRFASAEELSNYTGTSPVCRQSGKMRHVTRRRACNTFLKQTFHELAACTARWTPWAKAYYQLHKQRGMKHHAILRKLARCWLRILWRVWKDRKPYDDHRYQENLANKNPALKPLLAPA
jgi:transposase